MSHTLTGTPWAQKEGFRNGAVSTFPTMEVAMGNVSACRSWNGFGGKVDPGETSLEAAVRELEVTPC